MEKEIPTATQSAPFADMTDELLLLEADTGIDELPMVWRRLLVYVYVSERGDYWMWELGKLGESKKEWDGSKGKERKLEHQRQASTKKKNGVGGGGREIIRVQKIFLEGVLTERWMLTS